jgi:tetratricopeptide (TPR) repeat protein
VTVESIEQVQSEYDAQNYASARTGAERLLAQRGDDVAALWLAARASLALDRDDAGSFLRRIVGLRPNDVDAWRELGYAAEAAGNLSDAASSFREVLRRQPDDTRVLVDLGHTLYALGDTKAAISTLAQVVGREPSNIAAMRSLAAIYRSSGDLRASLRLATAIIEWQPFNVLALMDVADLYLELGDLSGAAQAHDKLRAADVEDGHELYANHGLIRIEIRRENGRRALDFAIDATQADRDDLTTQALAYIARQAFGQGEKSTLTRGELDQAFAQEAREHYRIHSEALLV